MNILAGAGEFFAERGCYVLHYPEAIVPNIRIKRHRVNGYVEAQVFDHTLWLCYEPYEADWHKVLAIKARQCGKNPVGIPANLMIPNRSRARGYNLIEPDSLNRAFNGYIRKHLFKGPKVLRGGL